jgi:hypothetical protein
MQQQRTYKKLEFYGQSQNKNTIKQNNQTTINKTINKIQVSSQFDNEVSHLFFSTIGRGN